MSDQPDHRELEDELRRAAARLDPVPPELVQAAVDAFGFRDLDAELAELVFDSLLDTDPATLVRSSSGRRLLSFKTPELTVDVEVTDTGPDRQVMGQVIPPGPVTVQFRHRDGTTTSTDADELGRFTAEALRPGPVSLRLSGAAGQPPAVVTDWLSI